MKTESLSTIKKELKTLPNEELQNIIIRLAKYKVENKQLTNYLLFEAFDNDAYILSVKAEIDFQFESLNKTSTYLAKKTIRKALRSTQKFIKFSADSSVEITLLIYFCKKLRKSGMLLRKGSVLGNIYYRQLLRIEKVLSTLHEDMQLDFEVEIELLKK